MDLPPRPPANQTSTGTGPVPLSKADLIADQFRRELRNNNYKLMAPPKPETEYYHQTFSLTLYRRHDGRFAERGSSSRRLDFGDGTGYLILEGRNVNVGNLSVDIVSEEEGWDIHMKRSQSAASPQAEHVDKKPKP